MSAGTLALNDLCSPTYCVATIQHGARESNGSETFPAQRRTFQLTEACNFTERSGCDVPEYLSDERLAIGLIL